MARLYLAACCKVLQCVDLLQMKSGRVRERARGGSSDDDQNLQDQGKKTSFQKALFLKRAYFFVSRKMDCSDCANHNKSCR